MLGLKSKTKTDQQSEPIEAQSDAADANPVSTRPVTVEKNLRPGRVRTFGRTLSFALNDDSVEMSAVYRLADRVSLLGIRKVYIPQDAKTEEAKDTFVVATIEEFMREYGRKNCTISLSVSGPETAFRTFSMPKLKPKQLSTAIAFEIKKQLPFPVKDCYYDYRRISKVTSGETESLKISLQAATRRLVEKRLDPFTRLGYDVSHVYNAPDAIGLLLQSLPAFADDTSFALISIERDRSQIAYYRGSTLEFYHYCSLGSSYLSSYGQDSLLTGFSELLADEIQNSLDFYTGQFSTRFSNQVFIYGDMAYADELVELLGSRFGFDFLRFPTEHLKFLRGSEMSQDMALPVCLSALAASVCDSKIANLLPPERQADTRRRVVDRTAPFCLILLALGLLLNWIILRSGLQTSHTYYGELTHNVETLRQSSVFVDYSNIKQQVEIDQSYLSKVAERPSYLGLNLKELSLLTPSTIRLLGLDLQGRQPSDNLILTGVVTTSDVPPEIILAEYIESLSKSAFYDNVTISRHNKKSVDDRFELSFTLKLTGVV